MIIFAGPTLTELARQLIKYRQFQLQPPIKRGDVANLIQLSPPATMVIVDGYFHQSLAVSHKEILDALEKGWQVTGLSSMGAIRAYELRDLGMKGFGKVFQRFHETEDFQDDEVAMLHTPAPDYQSISEPLVHMRVCMETLVSKGILSVELAEEVIHLMKNRYFGDRTMDFFARTFQLVTNLSLEKIVPNIDLYRIKQKDLVDFLRIQRLNFL